MHCNYHINMNRGIQHIHNLSSLASFSFSSSHLLCCMLMPWHMHQSTRKLVNSHTTMTHIIHRSLMGISPLLGSLVQNISCRTAFTVSICLPEKCINLQPASPWLHPSQIHKQQGQGQGTPAKAHATL